MVRKLFEQLQERMTGRFIAETIVDPDTGEEIIHENCMVTPKRAAKIMNALERMGRHTVKIRTVLSCRSHVGIVQSVMVLTWQQDRLYRSVRLLVLSQLSLSVSLVHS